MLRRRRPKHADTYGLASGGAERHSAFRPLGVSGVGTLQTVTRLDDLRRATDALRGKGTQAIPAGKIARFHTPGGAGFGDPKDRTPEALARDIENGLITPEAAARDYGYAAGGDD